MAAPTTRRTRFVCISDTHNAAPGGPFKLPKGDVLIHAGDMTNQGSFKELQRAVNWIEEADFECKLIIAGNHDITLDSDFYSQYGQYFHNQDLQDPEKCQELFTNSSSITWLRHEAAVVRLTSPDGPRTTFRIFGSPLSPTNGMWAFGYGLEEAHNIWDRIPLDSDIVLTHTPAKYHRDETSTRRAAGCEALRTALWRIRPRLAICGHVHEGRGVERVLWDLDNPNIKFKEASAEPWVDPGLGNKKMSLVDLSVRGGSPLKNDGSIGTWRLERDEDGSQRPSFVPYHPTMPMADASTPKSRKRTASRSPHRQNVVERALSCVATGLLAVPPEALPLATLGQGGLPPSKRCDLEALSGRIGRRETCIINAAIMASSYPHGVGGKKYNKPIVVDIDLPVWDE
ncbi:Metallo-dependent phosphatase [Glarea lozoyensis ATCC 20868]|uniref:Metallo-dependent phosphatase n=1 Tax=Glarea lozoyensis (strain ATCC 20868 / MF5171) TaxID=1116229 RepID=S3D2S8_GLAL2|nr:Metallo-dependent phosphatase [Glarea lozoyensis ATCC 20868]EPE32787.1 Metallo-dependent phosphatase [Glarea lozoyensis ATCC 20868]